VVSFCPSKAREVPASSVLLEPSRIKPFLT
jgi:hypothetical protein